MDYAYLFVLTLLTSVKCLQLDSGPPVFEYELQRVVLTVQQPWQSMNCTDIEEITVMGRSMKWDCTGAIGGAQWNTGITAYIDVTDGLIPMTAGHWSDRRWQITLAGCIYRGFLNITEIFQTPLKDPHRQDLKNDWPGFFITFEYILWNTSAPSCEPTTASAPRGNTCPPCPSTETTQSTPTNEGTTPSFTSTSSNASPTVSDISSPASSPPATTEITETTTAVTCDVPITEKPHDCGPYLHFFAEVLLPVENFLLALYLIRRFVNRLFQSPSSGGSNLESGETPNLQPPYVNHADSSPNIPRVDPTGVVHSVAQHLAWETRAKTQPMVNTESGIRPPLDGRRFFKPLSAGSLSDAFTSLSTETESTSSWNPQIINEQIDETRIPEPREEGGTFEPSGDGPCSGEEGWPEIPGGGASSLPSSLSSTVFEDAEHPSTSANRSETGGTDAPLSVEVRLNPETGEGMADLGGLFGKDADLKNSLSKIRDGNRNQKKETDDVEDPGPTTSLNLLDITVDERQRPRDNSGCSSLELPLGFPDSSEGKKFMVEMTEKGGNPVGAVQKLKKFFEGLRNKELLESRLPPVEEEQGIPSQDNDVDDVTEDNSCSSQTTGSDENLYVAIDDLWSGNREWRRPGEIAEEAGPPILSVINTHYMTTRLGAESGDADESEELRN